MPVPLNLTQLFANNAVSLLTAPLTATSTSLTVMTGHGALFPQPTGDGSDYFLITLEDQAASKREIIKVTGRVGDTFSFTLADRGLEGTTAQAWSSQAGDDTLVDHRVTAETLRRLAQLPQTAQAAGVPRFNQPYTLVPAGANTILQLAMAAQTGSTCLYVGGMRQKLGVDYTESAPDQLLLPYVLTVSDVNAGQSITIDFVPA
jgi:hypothetical protein